LSVSQATSARLNASADARRPLVTLLFMFVPPQPLGASGIGDLFHVRVSSKRGFPRRSGE
jgi:hypothetical protein